MRKSFVFLGSLVLGLTSHCFAVDSDGDGLDDSVETNTGVYVDENNTGTDPNNPDTDGDGWYDQYEVKTGFSALDVLSFPEHQTFKEINFEDYEIHEGIGLSSDWQRIQTTTSSEGTLHAYLNGITSGSISLVYSGDDGQKWRWPQSPRTNLAVHKSQAVSGGFIICGSIMGNHQFGSFNMNSRNETDPWVGFISTEGVWRWVKQIPTRAWSEALDLCIDSEGNIYVTGYIYDSVTIAGTSIGGAGWYDAFLTSLSADGDWRWATSLGGGSGDFGRSIRISNNGDLLWKGDFRSGASFQGENLNFIGGGSVDGAGDLFSALISSTDGTLKQITTYGTNSSERYLPSSNSDLLLSWHSSSYSIGSGSANSGKDLLVASKYNRQNGEPLRSVTIATDVPWFHRGGSVTLTSKSADLDYFFVRNDQTTDLVITDEDSVVYRRNDLELGGFVFLSAYNDSSNVPRLILTGKNDDDLGVNTTDILDVAIGEPIPQFQIIEGNFTWQEAKADAEAKGGRLAVLDTQEKIDASNAYLQELGEWPFLHLGLTDEASEGNWEWIDGSPLTAQNWADTEPNSNNSVFDEDYAVMRDSTARVQGWADVNGGWRASYLLEIIPQNPAPPLVQLGALYESPSGEAIVIDATPTAGFPTEYTYQWCFNGFKVPAALGGTSSSFSIDSLQANEGTWSVTVTNETGSVEQSFEYRIYADSDSDGLSDAYEELISMSDINNPDTDADGLRDAEEVNDYRTNPNSPDTDSDGFTDAYELQTAYDPNSADSAPDAQVGIMTAIEVNFNAALGATYDIQFSTDSVDWTVIEAGIVGEGNAVERLYSKKDFPTGFFRVERTDQ
jgi:hypothetical protein